MIELIQASGTHTFTSAKEALQAAIKASAFTGLLVPEQGNQEYAAWGQEVGIEVASIHFFEREDGIVEPPYMALQTFGAKLANKSDDEVGQALVLLENPVAGQDLFLDSMQVGIIASMFKDSQSALLIDERALHDADKSLLSLVNSHTNVAIIREV